MHGDSESMCASAIRLMRDGQRLQMRMQEDRFDDTALLVGSRNRKKDVENSSVKFMFDLPNKWDIQ